jgi:hypothetical protein
MAELPVRLKLKYIKFLPLKGAIGKVRVRQNSISFVPAI